MRLFSTLSLGFSRFFWTRSAHSCLTEYDERSNMCCYEGIYRNRFGRSFGSHPQANIDEMLVPRGFPREMMRARRESNPRPTGSESLGMVFLLVFH